MKCVTYLRVSTEEQTLEPQRIELNAYMVNRGWELVEEISDVISGGKVSREGLDRLLEGVREKKFDAVLVVKLDRMARSLAHFAQMVSVFDAAGVALIATSQGIDTSKDNPAGRLQMHVLAAVAEFERSIISERTKAGLVAARARGKKLGHPNPNLPENWREVIGVWREQTDGFDFRELARRLGGVSTSTAWRLAKKVLPVAVAVVPADPVALVTEPEAAPVPMPV